MSRLLAKRRVEPTWMTCPPSVETFGPEVSELCATAGFAPDPEQELILDLVFAVGPTGKSAAFEVDIIGPRQNFKTGVLKQMEIGWLFVTEERLVIHSAHELDTTEEAFRDLRSLIEDTPVLSKHLDLAVGERETPGMTLGNGKWGIHLNGGRRLRYKARTKSGGRGLTGSKIVLDEGFALTASHMGSLLPTLAAVPDPQVVTASSAGLRESAILRDKRDRGRVGASARQAYIEYGDKDAHSGCRLPDCDHERTRPGCALDDERRWRKYMTALDRRITVSTIRSMRDAMPADEFAREFGVWWEDPPVAGGTGVLDLDKWAEMESQFKPKSDAAVVLTIDVSPDRRTSTIAMATDGPAGKTLLVPYTAAGVTWVVPRLKELRDAGRHWLEVALHPSSQAGGLIPELVEAGIEFTPLTNQDNGAACSAFQTGVAESRYAHPGSEDLDSAVANATTRWTGEVELWDRRDRKINISPLVACSAAAYRWSLLRSDQSTEPFNVW